LSKGRAWAAAEDKGNLDGEVKDRKLLEEAENEKSA
jgi:hypothetical protein